MDDLIDITNFENSNVLKIHSLKNLPNSPLLSNELKETNSESNPKDIGLITLTSEDDDINEVITLLADDSKTFVILYCGLVSGSIV
ncbi:hypothetical protein WICMUC_004559 [Wickerhamomyces mucosus]|uniref:Uncharacterized protein n=1 Tax=Wickerhamomyces mucosus TaxID=1378264 RepID=A0A9P8PH03_9ASCO|nr:hypothetical protein WICMUC_004559 [Wickerhamomyces mucosus]